jgi:hypothetical protein
MTGPEIAVSRGACPGAIRAQAKARPWQVFSRADSSPLVNTGTSFSVTFGARSRSSGPGVVLGGQPSEELLLRPVRLLAYALLYRIGRRTSHRCTSCPSTCSHRVRGGAGDQVGDGEPRYCLGVGPQVLAALPSAAGCSRNDPISGWNTPASRRLAPPGTR